uniref:Uncharacterized protein n=1 Tax=Meloidogyne enterolobii TaxID=390850 RepID=A0A6V7Y925_MELEN|nr:unnamed protein product [Meloidogyne enterolobii]
MSNIYFFFLFVSILFLTIFKNVKTGEGVSIWEKWYRVSTFKCLKEKYSKEFVVVSANNKNKGKVNLDAEINIINARTAGFENIDIYLYPCVKPSTEYELCGDARKSITAVLDHLENNNAKFGRVWLLIYGLAGCEKDEKWNKDNKTENIEFIDTMVTTLNERNQTFGIFHK